MLQPNDEVSAFFRSGRSSRSTLAYPTVSTTRSDIGSGCHAPPARAFGFPRMPWS